MKPKIKQKQKQQKQKKTGKTQKMSNYTYTTERKFTKFISTKSTSLKYVINA